MNDPTPTLDHTQPGHPDPLALARTRALAYLADGPAKVFQVAEDMADLTETEHAAEQLARLALASLLIDERVTFDGAAWHLARPA